MNVLGVVVLPIVGSLCKIAIGWALGIIALVVGAALAIAGGGRAVDRPRRRIQ